MQGSARVECFITLLVVVATHLIVFLSKGKDLAGTTSTLQFHQPHSVIVLQYTLNLVFLVSNL
jgi:hypothetical protein